MSEREKPVEAEAGRRESVMPLAVAQLILGACSGGAMAYAAYVLTAPVTGVPPLFPYQDKVFHAVCFAALTGPAVLALPGRFMGFWIAHMAMLGIGIEVVQWKWIPSR